MAIVSKCPSCNSDKWFEYLTCKDFTVSHETFSLKKCKSCNLIVTSPRPEDDRLSEYYQSEQYISHSSKASTLIDRIYLIARSYTLKWKLGITEKYKLPSKTILDFGCGTGDFLKTCKDAGWTIQGIEPSSTAREKAIEKTVTKLNIPLLPLPEITTVFSNYQFDAKGNITKVQLTDSIVGIPLVGRNFLSASYLCR